MASGFNKIVAGIGMLIFVYLLVANGTAVATIIRTIATNSISGIKTLQGRA